MSQTLYISDRVSLSDNEDDDNVMEIGIQERKREMIYNLGLQYAKWHWKIFVITLELQKYPSISPISTPDSAPRISFQIKMINLREGILEIESYQLQW